MIQPDRVTIFFDGAYYGTQGGLMFGLVTMPDRHYAFRFGTGYDNNEAEWRAALKAIDLCLAAGFKFVEVVGDSKLVIKQAAGELPCHCSAHLPHLHRLRAIPPSLIDIQWRHVPRKGNPAGRELSRRQRRKEIP